MCKKKIKYFIAGTDILGCFLQKGFFKIWNDEVITKIVITIRQKYT